MAILPGDFSAASLDSRDQAGIGLAGADQHLFIGAGGLGKRSDNKKGNNTRGKAKSRERHKRTPAVVFHFKCVSVGGFSSRRQGLSMTFVQSRNNLPVCNDSSAA